MKENIYSDGLINYAYHRSETTMPLYTVHCTNIECNHDEEVLVPYTEKDLQVCPKCESRMTAIPSAPGCFLWSGDCSFSASGGRNTNE